MAIRECLCFDIRQCGESSLFWDTSFPITKGDEPMTPQGNRTR